MRTLMQHIRQLLLSFRFRADQRDDHQENRTSEESQIRRRLRDYTVS